MRNIFIGFSALLCCFCCLPAHSQEKLPDFGKIDKADLELKECSFDKNASAMNLTKTADVEVSIDLYSGAPKVRTEYRVRIKIFDEKAFEQASISIPYLDSRATKVTDVDAYIYNLDAQGKIVTQKLNKDQIFKQKGKGKKVYNSIRFTFPGLIRGSVVEYHYTRINKNGLSVKPWLFQDEIPTLYSKCSINAPSFTEFATHIVASQPVEKDSSEKTFSKSIYNESFRSFAMRNIPAFKVESMMTSLKDNLQRVEFAVVTQGFFLLGINVKISEDRWPLYNRSLLRAVYFGGQFDKTVTGTEAFVDSVAHLQDTVEKIKRVYQFVKNNITWNSEQTFYADDLNECWKDKSGSSAEMNILLLNLLRKTGVPCFPILISTRDNGLVDRSFPTVSQFNGVDILVVVDNTVFILDCTQKNLSYKTTPLNILNSEAFIIDKDNSQWILVEDKRPLMHTELTLSGLMDSTGVIKGSGRMLLTGVAKAEQLRKMQDDEKTNSKDMVDNNQSDLKIDSTTLEHDNDDSDTLIEKIKFHSPLSNTDNIYFFNPYMFTMFVKNPFKDSTRLSDIDFGCNQSYLTRFYFGVPENFSIEEVPKSTSIRMADSSIIFTREFFVSGKQIMVRNNFNINRALFSKEEYSGIKTFFDKIYALINEQVILKKKDE